MQIVLLTLTILALAGYYFLYYAPKKRVQKFAQEATKAGYKVKLMPFKFMGFYLVEFLRDDNGSLKIYKQELTKYDIVVGNMLSNLAILPIHPEILKDCFNQLPKLQKNSYFSHVAQLLKGGGLPFTEGQVWKRKRRIVSTIFHFDFLNSMIPVIQAETESEFKKLDEQIRKKQKINLVVTFSKILSSVIAKCFFGTDTNQYKIGDESFCQYYMHTLDQMLSYMTSLQNIVFGIKAYNYGLTQRARSLRKKIQIVKSIVGQITEKQLEKVKNKEEKNTNMLTLFYEKGMLAQKDQINPNKYTKDELMGQFFAFFGAGTDTTANTVNLLLHYLSLKPEYAEKIKQEVQNVSKIKEANDAQKLKNMKWIQVTFNEVLRIGGPAAGLLARIAVEKINAGGLQIPKNTSVNISPIISDFKSENFDNPFEFIPQRWIQNPTPKPYTYIPFGAGERNCIGQYLAKIQAKIIISKFVQRYNFKSKRPINMTHGFVYATHGQFDLEKIDNKS